MFLWLQFFALTCVRCFAGLLLCCQFALASEAVDLFTVTVDVESESNQERGLASRAALKTLFVRVTGDKLATETYPLLAKSLAKADRYIASFSYQKSVLKRAKNTDEPLLSAIDVGLDVGLDHGLDGGLEDKALSAEFDHRLGYANDTFASQEVLRLNLVFQSDAIRTLLREAGAPYWQANRPGVLVWLVEQRGGQRLIASPDNSPHFYQALSSGARARGIPLIQPLLDLEEASLISATDIWNMSEPIIRKASERYDNGAVLVGKLSQAYDQSWFGQWTLLYRGERKVEHYRGNDLNHYFSRGSDMVADRLAADYAVGARQQQFSKHLTIKFSGVKDHVDYVALSEYLRQIPALKAIQLSHINGEHCYFSLAGSNDIDKVSALIELNKRIIPAGYNSSDTGQANKLQYRWLGSGNK